MTKLEKSTRGRTLRRGVMVLSLACTLGVAGFGAVGAQEAGSVAPQAPASVQESVATSPAGTSDTNPTSTEQSSGEAAGLSGSTDAAGEAPGAATVPAAPPSAPRITYGDEDVAEEAPVAPALATAAPAAPKAEAKASSEIGRDQLPHNLSPWGMFLAADMVVKAVMISLAVASVLVWAAWVAKLVHVGVARQRVRRQTREIEMQSSISLAVSAASASRDPVSAMVREAVRELELSENGALSADGIKERVASRLGRIEAAAGRVMNSGTGLLATVGGTAPFIGLFGTVWGIMNSFIGISKAQTTNLAVVAPGIAEALLATAIGLVAAIPAVIFYNQLARAISGYKAALADCAAVIERHVSRDLDRHRSSRSYQLKAAE